MWVIVLLAAVAMIIQDILGVLMVQAEARNRGWLAGLFDSLAWPASIVTTTISVTALQGHDLPMKIIVVLAITAANMIGSFVGVKIGHRTIKHRE